MTTTADLVHEARQLIAGPAAEPKNVLASDYTAGSGEIQLRHPVSTLTSGMRLEVGYTEMFVLDVNLTTRVVSVYVADGSVDRDYSTGVLVTITPRHPAWRILRAMNSELNSLSSPVNGLYRIEHVTNLTALPADTLKVLAITSAGTDIGSRGWGLETGPVTQYATGVGIAFGSASGDAAVIARSFDPLPRTNMAADVESSTGLPATAHDILPLGAAVRLMLGREAKRLLDDVQGDSRRPDEVPPQAAAALASSYARERKTRIGEEYVRLKTRFPYRTL